MDQIQQTLTDIFVRQFAVDPATINAESSPKSVKAWDSMKHVDLVLEVEDVFGVSFATTEVFGLTSFAGLHQALSAKLALGEGRA